MLSLQERTATHSDEIDYAHAQAVSPEISFLLDLLTCGFLHGTFDSDVITASLSELVARRRARHEHGTAADDEADILYDIMMQSDVRDHGYLSRERVGALMHTLDTSQLLCELVFIPIPTRQYLTAPGVLSVLSDDSKVEESSETSSSKCFSVCADVIFLHECSILFLSFQLWFHSGFSWLSQMSRTSCIT